MPKKKEYKATIHANGADISVVSKGNEDDYISLTDIAKHKNPDAPADIVKNWLRSRSTIEFLGLWEQMNNPDFKLVEFDQFKNESGSNAFVLSPQKWISVTNAIGIISKSGRYGGTYAHKDIAFEFASWVSPEFKLYIIKDYQRLKQDENSKLSLEWNVNRVLSKVNYKIHTDAIKENLISNDLTNKQIGCTYANEADMLNMALFGKIAKQWRDENPDSKGNIRDYATIEQLIVMANLENMNANFIEKGLDEKQRLIELNKIARTQLKSLLDNKSVKKLEDLNRKQLGEGK
ncbi:KilA-N domain-containing protein [Haloimpatiens sp. FM7315]|uniref:KilA-N domain-containing protein n=1 Tax=Haloimpatiens sp. FM7315 TaxID=3298609 RepID=UPI0035A26B76